jgi:hypothetical protein
MCFSSFCKPYLDLPLAFSSFLSSAFLVLAHISSSFGSLRICDIACPNFHHLYIDLSQASETFLYLPGAQFAFFDLWISSICLLCLSTFHCQFIMMALTNEPCEIDFRSEKGKLTLDLRRPSGQEVRDQKDELTARIEEGIQKVADFRVRPDAAQAAA